jgi:hypothetical protein
MKTRPAIFGYWPMLPWWGSSNMIPTQKEWRHTQLGRAVLALRWTVPVPPSRRNVHPLHGKPGATQQLDSGHSGGQGRQALAQYLEWAVPVRFSDGNIQKL